MSSTIGASNLVNSPISNGATGQITNGVCEVCLRMTTTKEGLRAVFEIPGDNPLSGYHLGSQDLMTASKDMGCVLCRMILEEFHDQRETGWERIVVRSPVWPRYSSDTAPDFESQWPQMNSLELEFKARSIAWGPQRVFMCATAGKIIHYYYMIEKLAESQ